MRLAIKKFLSNFAFLTNFEAGYDLKPPSEFFQYKNPTPPPPIPYPTHTEQNLYL
jgi:hypothetical protein